MPVAKTMHKRQAGSIFVHLEGIDMEAKLSGSSRDDY
jgi:hypothetical protein